MHEGSPDYGCFARPLDLREPGPLLRRLILAGSQAIEREHLHASTRRAADIEATKGALAGVYGPDYLAQLREDWPA